jgi:hypothetical protein
MSDHLSPRPSGAPQRLPAKTLSVCAACGERVYFRARSSVAADDPRYRVEYLVCPACGASATRLTEIERLPPKAQKIRRVKYRYKT